jgi:Ser-tRNA(Ala) deacylase AlaX
LSLDIIKISTLQVTGVEDAQVILDQTLFYPLGGGQNWDIGTLTGPNGNLEVSEVRGRDDVLPHCRGRPPIRNW